MEGVHTQLQVWAYKQSDRNVMIIFSCTNYCINEAVSHNLELILDDWSMDSLGAVHLKSMNSLHLWSKGQWKSKGPRGQL